MFDFKISGIAAGAAFIFSLIIGFFSGIGMFYLFIRALIFAAVFFGLSCLIYWLITQFLPELLSGPKDDLSLGAPGSRVDISLDGPIVGAFPRDQSEVVDNIASRPSIQPGNVSSPLDQKEKTSYTKGEVSVDDGELMDSGDFGPAVGLNAGLSPEIKKKDGILPDMDGLVEASSETVMGEIESEAPDYDEPRRSTVSGKKPVLTGDFDPKELAQAIQTVLKKDEKG